MLRRLIILIAITMFSWQVVAQSQRLVLLEHFTQASCPPCATSNPSVTTLLNANSDKMTTIMYHTSWPGVDPMNTHNPQDAAARVGIYGVTGVPFSAIDGNFFLGSPPPFTNSWSQTTITNRYAVPSPFEMQIQQELSAGQDTIFVTALIKATQAVSGNMAAYLAVVEKLVTFTTPPGSNGETSFKMVMKKLLPNSIGTTLSTSYQPGDYTIIRTFWKLANVYDKNQLAVVGFVQDRTTREVHQAANSTTSAIVPPYTTDVALMKVYNIGEFRCSEDLSPRLMIRNQGSLPITSLNLKYSVNNGAEQNHQWTGNLNFLETAIIDLPSSNYTLGQQNVIKAFATTVNGGNDSYTRNDTINQHFEMAPSTSQKVYLILRTDYNPGQTTWEVTDAGGSVLYSGGPYAQSNKIFQETFEFQNDGCYLFTIHDAAGDGICCSNGYGVYQLTSDIPNQVLGQGDEFGLEGLHSFTVGTIGMDEIQAVSNLNVFPNPASSEVSIGFSLAEFAYISWQIRDISGRVVMESSAQEFLPGDHLQRIDISQLIGGNYILRFDVNGLTISRNLQVLR